MADKKWTLIGQTVTDHIVVPKTATHDNITRNLNNANADWTSIAKIVTKYKIKDKGTTHNNVIRRILDIKNGKITSLAQIKGNSANSDSSSSTDSSSSSSDDSTTSSTSSGPLNSTITKIPITDRDEAMDFALTEWNKIRRTSGHSLECQVFGSQHWQVGEWCKVYLPTLNEYTDMYITKVDHSNDSSSEWVTNLTLMDYAPSISELDPEDLEKQKKKETTNGDSTSTGGGDKTSKWTDIAKILQDNYEKPNGGWDDSIRSILSAEKYDPDIKSVITSLKQKTGESYVQVGHKICNILGIGF